MRVLEPATFQSQPRRTELSPLPEVTEAPACACQSAPSKQTVSKPTCPLLPDAAIWAFLLGRVLGEDVGVEKGVGGQEQQTNDGQYAKRPSCSYAAEEQPRYQAAYSFTYR